MPGTPFKIGDREFSVPRLRVAAFEKAVLAIQAAERIPPTSDPFGLERLNMACGAIVDLLRENHPELTIDDVKSLLRMDEIDAALVGVLKAGGKRQAQPGEALSP